MSALPAREDVTVLIPAAGEGERLGLGPKALLPLGYTAATMPPDTFKNQAKPVSTVGFPTVLITNKDLPASYVRYLERSLRTAFDMGQTAIKIRVRRRS